MCRGSLTTLDGEIGASTVYNLPYVGDTDLLTRSGREFQRPGLQPEPLHPHHRRWHTDLLDEEDGLISMQDLNGNTLEVFDDRIVSTSIDPAGGADSVRD